MMYMNADDGSSGRCIPHVLAVDDNRIDRKLVEKLLKSSSYRVTTAESAKAALEYLRDNNGSSVNLIITDYSMPVMTGYDLLRKIKESSFLKDIPVVVMSSENIPSRVSRCMEGGAERFWLKPIKESDVKTLWKDLLVVQHNLP